MGLSLRSASEKECELSLSKSYEKLDAHHKNYCNQLWLLSSENLLESWQENYFEEIEYQKYQISQINNSRTMEYSHQEAVQQINESPKEKVAEDLW